MWGNFLMESILENVEETINCICGGKPSGGKIKKPPGKKKKGV